MTAYPSDTPIVDAMTACGYSIEEINRAIEYLRTQKKGRGRPKKGTVGACIPPKKIRGRPKLTFERKQKIIVLWAYFTAGIPNTAGFRKAHYRERIEECIADSLSYSDTSSVRRYARIWNKFCTRFNQGQFSEFIHIHLDDNDVIGSRIRNTSQIFDKHNCPDIQLILTLSALALQLCEKT